jgi:hypothetical protein
MAYPVSKNTHIFNPKATSRQAVWGGVAHGAVTRTKPSPTLFISTMPAHVDLQAVEKLFAQHPGFLRFRSVRRLAFVDFMSEHHSISAMRAVQGVVVSGHSLVVDFDKDPDIKKEHFVERQQVDEELRRQLSTADAYFCSVCSSCCLHLSKAVNLFSLPTRATDGCNVVDEATQLRRLSVVRGPVKMIRREKGIERQFPLHCPSCDVPIGYRPTPLDEPSKLLYVYRGALKADKRAIVPLDDLLHAPPPESGAFSGCTPSIAVATDASGADNATGLSISGDQTGCKSNPPLAAPVVAVESGSISESSSECDTRISNADAGANFNIPGSISGNCAFASTIEVSSTLLEASCGTAVAIAASRYTATTNDGAGGKRRREELVLESASGC